ncbi:MAG TPA: hypothetical protein VI112_05745 [Bacteroidia bacterium]
MGPFYNSLLLISLLSPLLIFLDYNRRNNLNKAVLFAGTFYLCWIIVIPFIVHTLSWSVIFVIPPALFIVILLGWKRK